VSEPAELRLLVDAASNGVTNMARDEALLEAVARGESPPTLRFYQWDPPTVSLGYFQDYAEYEALPPPAGTLAVVRRTTGGGAILHDRELTYALVLPTWHPLLAGRPTALYAVMHDAIVAAIAPGVAASRRGSDAEDRAQRGPFFCFGRRHRDDVIVGGAKLAGSAQRRTQAAVLQHGSIILERRFAQQDSAALGVEHSDVGRLVERIVAALTSATGVTMAPGEWRPSELASAGLLREKYGGDAWTRRR
jgi:lipoate-protein ligase A